MTDRPEDDDIARPDEDDARVEPGEAAEPVEPSAVEVRNERRHAARLRAQRARTQQKRRQRGARVGLRVGVVVALLAIAAVVTLVLVDSVKPVGPGPANTAAGGITIGRGLKPVDASSASPVPSASATGGADAVRITMYVDYLCPMCGDFEKTNSRYIENLVRSGAATVDIHPIAILSNRSQGTKYSLRAANAAACVANSSPDQFFAVNRALFAKQPDEGTSGLSDAELTKIVTRVDGVQRKAAIASCIADQEYGGWIDARTAAVQEHGVPGTDVTEFPGTPLVLVNGKRYEYSQPLTNDEFRTFVISAAGSGSGSGRTATPEPTASASTD